MPGMFLECSKLKSLDLSNFDTSKIISMINLFTNCSELVYLDISNFNIENVILLSETFNNCNNLQYINISNYTGNNNLNDNNFFEGVPEDITYCFNSENEVPEFIEQLKNKVCSINYCSDDWKIKTKKKIAEKDICVYDCSIDGEYIYEFNKTCYNECPNRTYFSNENNKCIIICGEDLPFEMNDECVPNCNSLDFFNNICKINNQKIDAKELMVNTILNEIIDGSVDLLLSNVLNEEKKDYLIKNNNTEIFHITSLHNQKNNEYNNNISIIDIGECENILKELYEIDSTETLILFKTDFYIDNYSIPIT
jgi:surface protein